MKENGGKQIFDIFQERLSRQYGQYCDYHKLESNIGGFITYLIDHELIDTLTVKRFAILYEFDDLYKLNSYKKTQTVNDLADRFNLSARTVWSILKYKERKEKSNC
jgi:hypothetical protein